MYVLSFSIKWDSEKRQWSFKYLLLFSTFVVLFSLSQRKGANDYTTVCLSGCCVCTIVPCYVMIIMRKSSLPFVWLDDDDDDDEASNTKFYRRFVNT